MLKTLCSVLIVLACMHSASADYCEKGYKRSNDLCFRRSTTNDEGGMAADNWAKAKTDCEYRSATLVTGITSTTFSSFKTSPFEGVFWTGLRIETAGGNFRWLNEAGIVPNDWLLTWWKSVADRPTATTVGCVIMDVSGGIQTVKCDEKHYWYCQKPLIVEDSYESTSEYNSGSSSYSNRGYESSPSKYEASKRNYESNSYSEATENSETRPSPYQSESKYSNYESQQPKYESSSSYESKSYESKPYESKSYESKPKYDSNNYNSESKSYQSKPKYDTSRYNSESKSYESYKPKYDSYKPKYDSYKPKYDSYKPKYDSNNYNSESNNYNSESKSYQSKPKYDSYRPKYDSNNYNSESNSYNSESSYNNQRSSYKPSSSRYSEGYSG